jgi:hypothetical protein
MIARRAGARDGTMSVMMSGRTSMSRILVALSIALGVLGMAPRSWAQQCPPPPAASVRYSQRFYQAQKTLLEASRAAAAQLGVKLRDVSLPIGGSQIASGELEALSAVTLDQAYEYIREELATQRAAILAECSAALCQATAGKKPLRMDAALRAQALASICREPLQIGAGGWSAAQVIALPSPFMVVFNQNETERTVSVQLANLSAGTVALRIDELDGLTPDERTTMPALFAGKARKKRFELKPRGKIALPFVVRKPDPDSGPQVVSVNIVNESDGAVATSVAFYLVPSPDGTVPPPEVSCGTANPRAHIKALSDKDRVYEETHSTPTALTPGVEVKGQREWVWKNDGGAGAKSEYRMVCTKPGAGAVRFELTGTSGGRCAKSGTGKGGGAHGDPHWRTQVSLQGFTDTRWTIRVTSRARRAVQNGACKLVFDGKESTPVALDGSAVTLEKRDLPPGKYGIELDCTGEDLGCFGGPEYQWVTASDQVTVDVEARRQ